MNQFASLTTLVVALVVCETATAQVAGSSSVGVSVTEARAVASGWSVKKSILGRMVYNESNEKIGSVQDLVIAPDRSVSYLIIAAGGFVGVGKHDVAVPATQVEERMGKIVMPGASKAAVEALPDFEYAYTSYKRDELVANAEGDIKKAKDKLSDLESSASSATDNAKVSIRQRIVGLEHDVGDAQAALDDMKRVDTRRWKEFEKKVAAATARLRKSTDVASS